ncbi:MAG: hypothetical protein KDA83_08080, partial [Planctomycetales bacterium]|nr:hypothetical protein [Planctomycetales bacterium]
MPQIEAQALMEDLCLERVVHRRKRLDKRPESFEIGEHLVIVSARVDIGARPKLGEIRFDERRILNKLRIE